MTETSIQHAAQLIATADALFVGAGAGMSVDSGLAPYRGVNGRYTDKNLMESSGQFFEDHPEEAVRAAQARHEELLGVDPHAGYEVLHQWAQRSAYGAGVFTTNVDTMFARAGFNSTSIYEAHGSAIYSQCLSRCGADVFPTSTSGTTRCPQCDSLARPNVLLFGDFSFNDSRRWTQWEDLAGWFASVPATARFVILEIGAGTEVPIVRSKCRALSASEGWPLIRINTDEAGLDDAHAAGSVSVPMGALAALLAIEAELSQ